MGEHPGNAAFPLRELLNPQSCTGRERGYVLLADGCNPTRNAAEVGGVELLAADSWTRTDWVYCNRIRNSMTNYKTQIAKCKWEWLIFPLKGGKAM